MTHASVKMIIMSHLSDLQEEIGTSKPAQAFYMTQKLNFVKFLLTRFPDTTVEINADEQWESFTTKKEVSELKALREKAFELFEDKLANWNMQQCLGYFASDPENKPDNVHDMRKLIADLEYNYIMQATESDVNDAIKRLSK